MLAQAHMHTRSHAHAHTHTRTHTYVPRQAAQSLLGRGDLRAAAMAARRHNDPALAADMLQVRPRCPWHGHAAHCWRLQPCAAWGWGLGVGLNPMPGLGSV